MTDNITPDPRAALIAGLRELADWYETHPDVPLPRYPDFQHTVLGHDDAAGIAEVEAVASALGVDVKYDSHATAEHRFAGLTFKVAYASRESMRVYETHMAGYVPDRTSLLDVPAGQELEQYDIPAEAMTRLVPEPIHDPAEDTGWTDEATGLKSGWAPVFEHNDRGAGA